MRRRILDRLAVASWALAALACGCLLLQGVAVAQDAPPPPSEATPSADPSGPEAPAAKMKVVAYRLQYARSAAVTEVLQEVLDRPGAKISAGTGDRSIIVWGPDEVHEQVKQLLDELDAPAQDESPVLRVYPVSYAKPQALKKVLLEVLGQPVSKVAVDERKKTLIVHGPPKTHERVKQLIEELDVPESVETRTVRIFRLQQADPTSVAQTVERVLAGKDMELSVDQRARSVIIAASPDVHGMAEKLIEELDRSIEGNGGHRMEIFSLKHAETQSIVRLLASVIAEEFPDVRISEDKRLNSILLWGPDDAKARAAELIQRLDVPAGRPESRQVKVFQLEYAEAGEMVELVVNALGPKGSVAADNRTNSILATGPEEELKVVEAVLMQLDKEAQSDRREAMPAACQVRIVWLLGPMADDGDAPSDDLKEVIGELSRIGIKEVRQVAQTLVNTQVGGEFRLRCLPELGNETLPLTISGSVTQREGTPILKIQILAEKSVNMGAVQKYPPAATKPLVDLETEIAAPFGHSVVLGVTPVEAATSAFVVQIMPGEE